ncbi:DivIVA domain-containing protein [Rhodococcus sp. CSLK01-03]|uniref:DivIVA domain-containing protein n=1 Tax=Rhodococcus indonesiensis TaxID=3055869 RepID=A0ABT7RPL3_9NOCA|nr:DivIVA domain-containing protein [Rhodococcus indonesiensis]MDM7489580.1 DivIVA domain-containing protein [Rhodococcus indonesiensis]
MLTVLLYLFVVVVVGAVLFLVASAVFGRGETLAPIPPGATATALPVTDVTGADVRELRFQQVLRGYKTAEVDWALDRLAHEIDDLRARLAAYEDTAYGNTGGDAPGGDEADSGRTGASVAAEAAGDRSDEGE